MDLQNMDLKGGSLQISTEVIGKIACCAALEVDGVSEVSCGKQNKKVKELLAAASIQPPESGGQVWCKDPCCGRKGTGECQVCCSEHDQCHGKPCEPCHCRPCG